jgi:uncharacterized membrane protein YphA (DoxX/SURF4 family)
MAIASTIARILLGIMFTVFGANGFLHFIKMPPMDGYAGQFMGALFGSGMYVLVFATQLLSGILLLIGRYVALAVALLAPVLAVILVFHITMAPAGIGPGLVATILWVVVVVRYRNHFTSLFDAMARA